MPRRAMTRCHTPALLFFDPPSGLVPELDFTQFEYLFVNEEGEILAFATIETICALILNPKTNTHDLLNSLQMRVYGSDDPPRIAHFPSIFNCYPINQVFEVFLNWCLGSLPPSLFNPSNALPAFHVLDPKPVIHFDDPIWEIDYASLRLCVGAYTDTFKVLKIPPFPHILHLRVGFIESKHHGHGYHYVDFTPFPTEKAKDFTVAPREALPSDSLECCWNVRGLGRPSLLENFHVLYEVHHPVVVILLETRHGYNNIASLVTQLPGNYSFGYSLPTSGLCGGVVYLWNMDVVAAEDKRFKFSEFEADVYFKGTSSRGDVYFSDSVDGFMEKAEIGRILRVLLFNQSCNI